MSVNAVWNSYIQNSGNPPSSAFKLIVYSRRRDELKTLTFDEAKHLIDTHNNNTHNQSSKNNNKQKKNNKNKKKSTSDYNNHISSNKPTNKSKSKPNTKKKSTNINDTNKHQLNKSRSHSNTTKSKKKSDKHKKNQNKHINPSQQPHLSTNYRSRSKSKKQTNTRNQPRSKSSAPPKKSKNNERISLKQKHKTNHKTETIKKQKTQNKSKKSSKNKIRSKSISVHRTNPEQNNNNKKHSKRIKSDGRKHRKHKIRANSTAHMYDNDNDNDTLYCNKINEALNMNSNKNNKDKLLPKHKPNMLKSLSTDSYNNNSNKKYKRNSICIYDENNNEQKQTQIKFRKKHKDKKRVKSLWSYDKSKSIQPNDNISFRKKKKDKIRAKSVCSYDYDENDIDEKQSFNTFFNSQKKVPQKHNNNVFNPAKLQKISAKEIKQNLVEPAPIKMGDAVLLTEHREGLVKYIGNVHFADGVWFGIELVNGAIGLHDGIIDKQRYFKTAPYRGIFVQGNAIRRKARHRDYHSSPKLRRRASLEQIAKIKIEFKKMQSVNELDNVTVDVLDSDECFIVKEGIFKKMGAVNKGYKSRWFKLYAHRRISYFELNGDNDGPKGIEKGSVDLMNILNINKKKTNIIEMKTIVRKWVFKYNTCEDRDEWYDALKDMCGDGKKNKKRKKYKYRQKAKNTSVPLNLVIGTPVDISNVEFDVDYV